MEMNLMQKDIFEQRQSKEPELSVLKNASVPEDGIYVHGIYIEAGKWNHAKGGLVDAEIGELATLLPVLWLKPTNHVDVGDRYEAPMYKTPVRAGILSTTGHSTNFVLSVLLNSDKPSNFWVLRGTALVMLLTE